MNAITSAAKSGDLTKVAAILSNTPSAQLIEYALLAVGESQLTCQNALDIAHYLLWHPCAQGHYYNQLFGKIINGNFHGRLEYSYPLYLMWYDKYSGCKKPLSEYKSMPRLKRIAVDPVDVGIQANWFNLPSQNYKSDLVPF